MTFGRTLLMLLALAFACQAAVAGGDPAAGKEKSSTCAACHGPTGDSENPQFPKIAGQYEDYLVQALHEYKSGKRKNGIMQGIVAGLSYDDMENLAAYFASQSSPLHTPHP
jgi:cytochrome c553